jgi:hypothetical protein
VSRAADARDYAGGSARVEKECSSLNEFKGLAKESGNSIHVLAAASEDTAYETASHIRASLSLFGFGAERNARPAC